MSNITELSIAQLKKAVAIKERIATLEGELASLLGTPTATPSKAKKKGGMSAAGRAAVAAAQKARWAKIKGLAKVTGAKPARRKPMISAAGIARIKAAQKARWAKIKAAKKA